MTRWTPENALLAAIIGCMSGRRIDRDSRAALAEACDRFEADAYPPAWAALVAGCRDYLAVNAARGDALPLSIKRLLDAAFDNPPPRTHFAWQDRADIGDADRQGEQAA